MLTCKQVAAALDSGKDQSLVMKMRLHAHCLICRDCSHYVTQLTKIKKCSKELLSKLTRIDTEETRQFEEEVVRRASKKR